MTTRRLTLLPPLLLIAVLAAGAKPCDTKQAGATPDAAKAEGGKKGEGGKRGEAPVCMRCGASCGLRPICVCEPGTKKRPIIEFDTTCEPICIAGCGGHAWSLGGGVGGGGCTGCRAAPDACPGTVRFRRKLEKETSDEEVPTIVRTVKYVCDCCSGRCAAGCCGGAQRPSSWWTTLTWWWPRKPAG